MNFILFAILVWLVAIGAWWMLTRSIKNADADRIKSRLIGAPRNAKRAARNPGSVSLISRGRRPHHGQDRPRLLQKFQLQESLRTMLEQAGFKWNLSHA
jgi:hypothetical protein